MVVQLWRLVPSLNLFYSALWSVCSLRWTLKASLIFLHTEWSCCSDTHVMICLMSFIKSHIKRTTCSLETLLLLWNHSHQPSSRRSRPYRNCGAFVTFSLFWAEFENSHKLKVIFTKTKKKHPKSFLSCAHEGIWPACYRPEKYVTTNNWNEMYVCVFCAWFDAVWRTVRCACAGQRNALSLQVIFTCSKHVWAEKTSNIKAAIDSGGPSTPPLREIFLIKLRSRK